jgi:hypothetical protein
MTRNIPYKALGIDPEVGKRVETAIDAYIAVHPGRPVSIKGMSAASGVDVETVKSIFYAFLALRHFKTTFTPVHKPCNMPLGPAEDSAYQIDERAYRCMLCIGPVERNDIEIRLTFWVPGADVDNHLPTVVQWTGITKSKGNR